MEAEDSEGVAGAEDIEDLDRKRCTLGRIWTKSSIRQGPTAGSEMDLPFLFRNLP